MKSSSTIASMLMMALLSANAEATGIFDANQGISKWINPNAFVGIVLILLFFWVCICVFNMLAQVQTPRIMLEKTIDWGKVERTDEWSLLLSSQKTNRGEKRLSKHLITTAHTHGSWSCLLFISLPVHKANQIPNKHSTLFLLLHLINHIDYLT